MIVPWAVKQLVASPCREIGGRQVPRTLKRTTVSWRTTGGNRHKRQKEGGGEGRKGKGREEKGGEGL